MSVVAEGHFKCFRAVEGLKEPQVKIINTYVGYGGFKVDEFELLVPKTSRIYERRMDGRIRYYVERPTNISLDIHIYDLHPGSPERLSVLKYIGQETKFPVYFDP